MYHPLPTLSGLASKEILSADFGIRRLWAWIRLASSRIDAQGRVLCWTFELPSSGVETVLGHVINCDYYACLGRIIIPILSLTAAVAFAVLFGTNAHDDLGIASATIRTDALSSAGFLFIVLAFGNFLKRNR